MGIGDKRKDTRRVLALDAIRDAVLASMDATSVSPLQFGDDEIPDVAHPEEVTAVAMTALCMVVNVTGLRKDNVQHIFGVLREWEEGR